MVALAVEGIDLFKIVDRSISGWIPSLKTGAAPALEPRRGVLRLPSHDKRKTRIPVTSKRWAMCEPIWEVVAGERK